MSASSPPARPRTIITTHFNPDYDAVGSMVAARKLYPEAALVFPGGSEKNLRHFFIQSLFHILDPIHPRDVDLSGVERLVLVDTRQPGRLGDLRAVLSNPGLDIHLYDHHPDAPGDLAGSVTVTAPVGSTVTLMTEIIRDRGLELSPEEATMMAVGLYEDTGSFTFSSTTGRDHLAAVELLKRGADLEVVSQLTVRELTTEQLALLHSLIDSAETRQARGLSLVIACAESESHIEDLAVLVHKMMEIMGLSILFALVAMDNKVQLIIRSRPGTVNAALIAREFGGGGHPSAAAASIRNMSLNQARQRLDEILTETLGAFFQARNLMVYPPLTVGENQTLREAREMLIKFSINVLLAVDRDGRVTGFISEHNITKALHHGLLDYPVGAFMNTEFISVDPAAGFAEIKAILIDRKQRILPVVENDRAVGVITRTDLLTIMAAEVEAGPTDSRRPDLSRRNVAALLREHLPPRLAAILERFGHLADRAGVNIYAVGGCVRDLIMRKPIHDVDLTLDGDLNEFLAAVTGTFRLKKVVRHPRFKTAKIHTPDGFTLDLSTTRREYYEHPGALPVVQEGSLRLDLYRRDFTINTLAVSLGARNHGEVVDFFLGYQDIKDGYIRVLHSLSFVEDPTRAFRAVRFESRLGFKISKMTATLLEGAVKNNFMTNLDRRRLGRELELILSEADPGPALKRLAEFKLLPFIHPKISLTPQHHQMFTRIRQVRDWLALTFPEKMGQAWFVYLMALTDRLRGQALAELAEALGLKKKEAQILNEERPQAEQLARSHKKTASFRPSQACSLFSGLSWPAVLFVMARTENQALAQAGAAFLTAYRQLRPLLTGRDLLALGWPSGPGLKDILEQLRRARLDGLVNTRADELAWAERALKEPAFAVCSRPGGE